MKNVKRNKRIMVWVSEDEKNLLEAKAKFYGYKTFAAYIRDAAVFEKITHIDIEGKKEIYDAYSENTKELKKIIKELRHTLKYATQINEMDISSIKTILFNIIRNQKESLKLIAKKLNYNEWQEINHSRNIGGK